MYQNNSLCVFLNIFFVQLENVDKNWMILQYVIQYGKKSQQGKKEGVFYYSYLENAFK